MTAVTLILLVVGLTSRFIQYLGQAVAGELGSDVLLLLMFYRLPDFFLVIVPLAFSSAYFWAMALCMQKMKWWGCWDLDLVSAASRFNISDFYCRNYFHGGHKLEYCSMGSTQHRTA
ncbi:MAG: hypothetical protein CM1200mP40_20330 [Gammaproteobacteria bacterium]|nr:MAG: hypothetical protein CM1200mP40_20330 [Gammaproteobacteria bacterium]